MSCIVNCTGNIIVDKFIETVDTNKLYDFFDNSDEFESQYIDIRDDKIYFDGEPGFFSDEAMKELEDFIKELGYYILPESYIEVYGDEDGAYVYTEGIGFEYLWLHAREIRCADDQELINELKRRHPGFLIMETE